MDLDPVFVVLRKLDRPNKTKKITEFMESMETLAGHGAAEGNNDGRGEKVRMRRPSGLCIDPHGYCFFADTGSCLLISCKLPIAWPLVCVYVYAGAGKRSKPLTTLNPDP